ncbi:hypothetical protein L489_3543 [Bordetella bronchiseptica 00-P-2730]|nr:hypothetical protein L489_3543 [Bordetella bronchiseptica 00-P-2730]
MQGRPVGTHSHGASPGPLRRTPRRCPGSRPEPGRRCGGPRRCASARMARLWLRAGSGPRAPGRTACAGPPGSANGAG